MLEILKRIKPISKFIWLNVLPDNERAFNLYLDIGFEFVFNNKTDLLDMIYVDKNIISSRGNLVLTTQRENVINDMVNYKIYRNYINRIQDTLVFALNNTEYKLEPQTAYQTIRDFMEHVSYFLNPSSEEMDTDEGHILKQNRPPPVLSFSVNNTRHFLFINSLVNNISSFNKDLQNDFEEKLLNVFLNTNIGIEDLKILFRTLFIIKPKPTVTIINEDQQGRYFFSEGLLNLNLFVIINQFEISTYPNININRSSDIYNIEINNPDEINNIDIHIKNAIYRSSLHSEVPKICIKISKNIALNLRRLYYTYNLLPSYSACPYKPNTFVYNIKRFNNINNRFWELDNFDFNNLYVLPNDTLERQPITKDILATISGCNNLPDSLENYFIQYLDYLNPTRSILINQKVHFPNIGEGIFLSFLGYLIYRCNEKFITKMLVDNNLNLDLNQNNLMRWIHMTPFLTLNYYDFDRIKPDLIHNINIFCYTRIIDYMCSNSHGSMLTNPPLRLERGQKLIMYTRPGNLFYMSNLNYNFLSLIFDTNNVQKLFNCIELLNNRNIRVSTFINQYRDIIRALLANNSYTDSDVFMYTDQYYDHALLYNEEVTYWVNYPISNPYFYHYLGNFRIKSPKEIELIDNIDTAKINSNFSLDGLYVNFNTDNNDIDNKVSGFDLITRTVTFTKNIPAGATRVLISNLIYQYQYRTTRDLYYNIVMNNSIYNGCNRPHIINYLDGINDEINAVISNSNQNIYTNNFETNTNTFFSLTNTLYNRLNNLDFRSQSNIPSDETLRELSIVIIFKKIIEGSDHVHDKRLSIETNTNITLNNFTKRDTHNLHVKEYTNPNITINLSTLLDKKMKYNSFICCRGVEGVNVPINIPPLQGEMRVRDILRDRKPELDLFFS
jgi:hypothetical protein